jgi:hypothetical protein
MSNAYYLNQYISTTLASVGGIDDSATTGIILASVTNIATDKPGIACITYTDPIDVTKAEWITYTSIDSGTKELEGVTRGQEGFSAKAHDNGATVAFPLSESHINNLNDALIIGADEENLVEGVLDEDTMSSDSATKLATQQSIKDYVGHSVSVASDTTPTPTGDRKRNELYVTALEEAAEFDEPSGTPANGNILIIRVKDDGTARALTYNAIYSGIVDTLPSTTTVSKVLYMGFIYNSTTSKWEMVAKTEES